MSGTSFSSSTPLSTMKTIQKRLYTVLPRASTQPTPRVRSNSGSRSLYTVNTLSFFDSPPSPRPNNVLTTTRLAVEGRGEVESGQNANSHLPFSLALTAPNPSSQSSSSSQQLTAQYSFFPYSSRTGVASKTPAAKPAPESSTACKRQKFQLDIGAYGIPKRRQSSYLNGSDRQRLINGTRLVHTRAGEDSLNLAVQVGEDAYFIHNNNAMGVADGVGGWGKVNCPGIHSPQTPSSLFARRLMHFCASELDSIPRSMSTPPPPPLPLRSSIPTSSLQPRPSALLSAKTIPWSWSDPIDSFEEAEAELEEHLEELEEGIDVLMILERAYQSTLKEHVVPQQSGSAPKQEFPPPPSGTDSSPQLTFEPGAPLLAGSSTALLAVLDHVPKRPPTSNSVPSADATQTDAEYEAVVKIAHIGDCMGMLVRDDEIVWRSEEMWWSFNTPVQLSALPSSVSPWSSAHTFTLPVQADDVLILASDGLSDNLWDEDILDEVSRFRKDYLRSSASSLTASPADESSKPTTAADRVRWRQALAGMLSEALCSRARSVSERRQDVDPESSDDNPAREDEIPFARRARENGRTFRGGKNDDISVVVAVISPAADLQAV